MANYAVVVCKPFSNLSVSHSFYLQNGETFTKLVLLGKRSLTSKHFNPVIFVKEQKTSKNSKLLMF